MQLIILDRDGVINKDSKEFIKSPEEWEPIPGSIDAIARLTHAQYHIVLASNQSGLARGLFDINALNRINQKMHREVAKVGGRIDAIFYCPHGPDDGCVCRKPKPGLLIDIAERLKTDLANVPIIGDSFRDIQAAQAVGARAILVRTGNGKATEKRGEGLDGVEVYSDLASAVEVLLVS